jgi:hypothetical protein
MEDQGTGLSGHERRPEPSWPTVIATTVRLWVERHPVVGSRALRGRRGVLAIALAFALWAAVSGVFIGRAATSSHPAASPAARPDAAARSGSTTVQPGSPAAAALGASGATRDQAARWIAKQVAASAIVACDPAMCGALQATGITASRLLALGTAAADPLGSDVVVATPALRNQFGGRLDSVYAPAVIASFGSGAGRIEVRAIAPSGAVAYKSALAADRRARIAAGRQLLGNPRVSVIADAVRTALIAGDVDPRLLMTLAAFAAEQPVRIIAFADPSPGASSAVSLRGAEIVPLHAGNQTQARLRSLLSFVDAQRPPFLPLRARLVRPAALRVEYAAPSPLGLLGGY